MPAHTSSAERLTVRGGRAGRAAARFPVVTRPLCRTRPAWGGRTATPGEAAAADTPRDTPYRERPQDVLTRTDLLVSGNDDFHPIGPLANVVGDTYGYHYI